MTTTKTPAVAAGGDAAGVENPGGKGQPGEQQQEQKEDEEIQ